MTMSTSALSLYKLWKKSLSKYSNGMKNISHCECIYMRTCELKYVFVHPESMMKTNVSQHVQPPQQSALLPASPLGP